MAGKSAALLDSRRVRSGAADLDQPAVLDDDGGGAHAVRPAALGVVHQRIRLVNQVGRKLLGETAAFGDGPEPEADHPNVDLDRVGAQPFVFGAPVMSLDGLLEPLGNVSGLDAARKLRYQETELVAPETRMQVARLVATFHGQEVLGADLIRQNLRHALDDAIAGGMAQRVVVAFEAGNVYNPDTAPADALLDREVRFDPFHEPVEVEQLRLRVPMRLLGQLGDDIFEIARDVADGDVLLGQLPLQPLHLGGEAFRQRLNCVVFRLLDELPLTGEHFFDDVKQLRLPLQVQVQPLPDPFAKILECTRHMQCGAGGACFLIHIANRQSSKEQDNQAPCRFCQAHPLGPGGTGERVPFSFSVVRFPFMFLPMWPIVRDALANASPSVRRQIWWVLALWTGLVIGQIWDSRNAHGAAGVAEFLSAVLGATGVAFLGAVNTLQRTMEESVRRRPQSRDGRDAGAVQQVLVALPLLGFASGVLLGAAAALMVLRALLGTELLLAVVALTAYSGMLVFAGRTITNSTRTLFHHAEQQAAAAAEARGKADAAQLAALQARMNPHFLFNALNTVASLVRSDPPTAERVVENLSGVLRRTLQRSTGHVGTVDEEVDYVRDYLALEQERWGSRLRVEWEIEDDARSLSLPPLVLQPLVENALTHGIGSRLDGGVIRISIRGGEQLTIRVDDDGAGFAPRWKEGTGLGNLRERLQTLYSGGARIDTSSDDTGAHVTVTVPRDCRLMTAD
jgi:hypothetical protein